MFFSAKNIKQGWGFVPKYIIHVGAHEAEEYSQYQSFDPFEIHWVEAQSEKCLTLKDRFLSVPGVHIHNAALWGESGIALTLKVTNNGESTSLLEFGTHATLYPKIFKLREIEIITKTMDEVFEGIIKPDFLNVDIQGAELQALIGGQELLTYAKIIYLEVNKKELYKGAALVGEIDQFLRIKGFTRSATRWWLNDGWGDAVYISDSLKNNLAMKNYLYIRLLDIQWQFLTLLRFGLRMFKSLIS